MHWISYIFAIYACFVILSLGIAAIEFAKNPTRHMAEGKRRYQSIKEKVHSIV